MELLGIWYVFPDDFIRETRRNHAG